jgi:hypothetical protein
MARDALLLLEVLMDYGKHGGLSANWSTHADVQMKERGELRIPLPQFLE